MKGFTKDNLFHPLTDKKGIRRKEGKSINPSGIKLPSLRKSRDSGKEFSKETRDIINKELGLDDFEVISYNPKWKLTRIMADDGVKEFYILPDEDHALDFGEQSVRDFIGEDGGEFSDFEDIMSGATVNGKFDKEKAFNLVMDMETDYGTLSRLGGVSKVVAGYDGTYSELSDGSIAFQVAG